MATLAQLDIRKELRRLGGGLVLREQAIGRLYAFPHVTAWFDRELPKLDQNDQHGSQSCTEQLDELMHDFVTGENLDYYARSHSMRPREPGVWELKTPDLRLFGWFHARLTFVVAEVDTMARCKEHDLYAGYRESVVRRREKLPLDEPKFITGTYDDVL